MNKNFNVHSWSGKGPQKKSLSIVLLLLCCLAPLLAEPCGDVNSDGTINIVDALMCAQYYVGLNPLPFDLSAANVNGDGTINIVDALQIAQYYVGLIASFPGCPVNEPVTYELQAETEATWDEATIESEYSGYTGSGYVNTSNSSGRWLQWNVDVLAGCSAICVFTYTNGSGSSRSMDVSVNGNVVTSLSFPGTGAWDAWSTETETVNLNAGSNAIRLTATNTMGAPNMDKMDITIGSVIITPAPTISPTPTLPPTPTPTDWTPTPTPPPLFANAWVPDLGNGTYKNPIIYADYSDPDVIKVGSDFYMTASSFNCVPGLPILHSKDLVNWTIIGHALQQQVPVNVFDVPQHAKGVWAPSIRYHDGQYWIFYGDPDHGIYMLKATNPAGPWDPPVLVKSGRGYIDTCPIWDDDGNAYLVHAWAKSRVGFNSILTLHRMKPDGTELLDNGTDIFDGNGGIAKTLEGPKFYKRNGYYYIFAPAGGVADGWQVVLRSSDIYGPYAIRTVMERGSTNINGPHQGGYVELDSGESWFIHFQKVVPYGRLVHLNPMQWRSDDWPVIGSDPDGNGTGNPVSSYSKPDVGGTYPVQIPQTSDDFASSALGLQWQWQANYRSDWLSLTARPGYLRLYAQPQPSSSANYYLAANLLLQKLPAKSFSVITHVSLNADRDGERAGLIVMGYEYDYIALKRNSSNQVVITRVRCSNANGSGRESESDSVNLQGTSAYLRLSVSDGARCQLGYSTDGQNFQNLGSSFTAAEGGWIGGKFGIFSMAPYQSTGNGYADFDYFQFY